MISVLIVDDDFMVAKVHAGFVAALDGFEVVGTASTGTQALEDVVRLRPDLVLLDVYLPDMTGLDVLRRLRAAACPSDVIVISAARDVDSIRVGPARRRPALPREALRPPRPSRRGSGTTPRCAATWPSWGRPGRPTSTGCSGPAGRPRPEPRS